MSASQEQLDSGANARRIVAVGAGKGGGGTSVISANLAVFLAQIGKRVALIDANLPDAGLHSWLGMPAPEHNISDVLYGRVERLRDAMVETPVTGLYLLAGARDLFAGFKLTDDDHRQLLARIRNLETDFVFIDLPAGLSPLALDILAESDVPIALTVATPDAVESTYRFLVAALLRKLIHHAEIDGESRRLLEDLSTRPGRPPNVREIIDRLRDDGSPFLDEALHTAETFHPQLLINQVRIKTDEGLGEAMVSASARWIGLVPRLLGTVEWDDNVWLSLRRGRPLLIDFPQSRACRGLERIVRRLLGQEFAALYAPEPLPLATEQQNLYELLETYPGASEEEVRRALKRVRDLFGAEGLAAQGACSEDQRLDYQRRAEEAHAALVDKSRRREYDRETFPDGFPTPRQPYSSDGPGTSLKSPRPHDSLPKVELRDDQIVDGAFLGEVRRDRGVELVDISNRAKISVSYLKAIEEERFDDLPAAVYIRGFITEYARYLKIDPSRAVRDFLEKYERHENKVGK